MDSLFESEFFDSFSSKKSTTVVNSNGLTPESGDFNDALITKRLTSDSESNFTPLIGDFHDDLMRDLSAEMYQQKCNCSREKKKEEEEEEEEEDADKVPSEKPRKCPDVTRPIRNEQNSSGNGLNELQESENEMEILKSISVKTAALREKLSEIVSQSTEERSKQQKIIREEKERLEKLELKHQHTSQLMKESLIGSVERDSLMALYKSEQSDLEKHRCVVDDLEFQLLETESRYEEQKETLQQQLMDDQRQLNDIYKEHQLLRQNDRKNRTNEDYISSLKLELSSSLATSPGGGHLPDPIAKTTKLRLTFLDAQANDVIEQQRKRLEELRSKAAADAHLSWNRRKMTSSYESPQYSLVDFDTSKPGPVTVVCAGEGPTRDDLGSPARGPGGKEEQQGDLETPSPQSLDSTKEMGTESGSPSEGSSVSNSEQMSNISSASFDNDQRLVEIMKQLESAQLEKRLLLQAHMRQTIALEELRTEKQKRLELEQRLQEELAKQNLDNGSVKLRQDKRQQARPLTRYLPVRNGEIDLPEFLEQCGHNFELCPHISVSSMSARGLLTKMGGRIKSWRRRWFVFDRTRRHLAYYVDKSEAKRKGSIPFQSIDDVFIDHVRSVKSPNPQLTFCVKTKSRTYYFVSPSVESMQIWIEVIFTGAEGYKEFV